MSCTGEWKKKHHSPAHEEASEVLQAKLCFFDKSPVSVEILGDSSGVSAKS
jgi:hypothetical protein